MSKIHKGDYWKNIDRSMDNFSDSKTQELLNALNNKVQEFNRLFGYNFQVFESNRSLDRQLRLIRNGRSQANPEYSPHVQKRAVDYAEFREGSWYWERDKIRKLWSWLKENFEQWPYLRTGGSFRTFLDLPHYEIKLKHWVNWQ